MQSGEGGLQLKYLIKGMKWSHCLLPSPCISFLLLWTNPHKLSSLKSCPFTSSQFCTSDASHGWVLCSGNNIIVTKLKSRSQPGYILNGGGSGGKPTRKLILTVGGTQPLMIWGLGPLSSCWLSARACSQLLAVTHGPLPSISSHALTSDPDLKRSCD